MGKYYEINENIARTAKEINSFREYKAGEATEAYKARVDKVYAIADQIAEKKPNLAEKAYGMADRYSRKLAEYYNSYYRNEASCPSVMICGPANFPVKKKQRQNSRRESLASEWKYLEEYEEKIQRLLTMEQPINAADEDAIEQLEAKIKSLEEEKEAMKAVNAYFRKNGTLEGYEGTITKDMQSRIDFVFAYNFQKFGIFDTSNINNQIKATKGRLESLRAVKEAGTKATENPYCKVVENTENMRLQLFFDDKPSDEVRNAIKKRGFKWAPSQGAWQRQLTENARYSLMMLLKDLEALA